MGKSTQVIVFYSYAVVIVAETFFNVCVLDCKDGVTTVGGNAQGACCMFPFIYKGVAYWTCTAQNASRKWCSVTKVYELERKWGYCA